MATTREEKLLQHFATTPSCDAGNLLCVAIPPAVVSRDIAYHIGPCGFLGRTVRLDRWVQRCNRRILKTHRRMTIASDFAAELIAAEGVDAVTDIVCGKRITDDGAGLVLRSLRFLTTVSLEYCRHITNRTLNSLKSAECGVSTLTTLRLAWCTFLDDFGVEAVAALPYVTTLDLRGCDKISGQALHCLAAGAVSRSLEDLCLAECFFIDDGGVAAFDTTRPGQDRGDRPHLPWQRLESLDLLGTKVTEAGIPSLRHLPRLRTLCLAQCSRIVQLGWVTALPESLAILDVTRCLRLVGKEADRPCAVPLETDATCPVRDLTWGVCASADALRCFPNLTGLTLEEAPTLSPSHFPGGFVNPHLFRRLSLMNCSATDETVSAALAVMPQLRELEVGPSASEHTVACIVLRYATATSGLSPMLERSAIALLKESGCTVPVDKSAPGNTAPRPCLESLSLPRLRASGLGGWVCAITTLTELFLPDSGCVPVSTWPLGTLPELTYLDVSGGTMSPSDARSYFPALATRPGMTFAAGDGLAARPSKRPR